MAQKVVDLCDEYMEAHAKPSKRSWKDDQQRIETYVKPDLGSLVLAEVTKADVGRLYRRIRRNHAYLANRVLALVKVMFNLAVEWEFLPADFPNPARISGVFREPMREHFSHTSRPQATSISSNGRAT